MGVLYKFPADIKPSLYIITLFCMQLLACYYISNLAILIVIGLISLTIPGLTSAAFNHHHQHHNIFKYALLNRLFEIILGLQTGITGYAWVLHHNLGHHQHYRNQHHAHDQTKTTYPLDESRWAFKDGRKMGFWQYSIIGFLTAFFRVHQSGFRYKGVYKHYIYSRLVYYAVAVIGLYCFGLSFALIFIIPSLIVLFFTVGATYKHHAGLRSDDHYSSSFNNINKHYNTLTCNLGYHTAHHLRPGLHWSLLPAFHASICDKIPPELVRDERVRAFRLLIKIKRIWSERRSSPKNKIIVNRP